MFPLVTLKDTGVETPNENCQPRKVVAVLLSTLSTPPKLCFIPLG
jgi:hypothetical protein